MCNYCDLGGLGIIDIGLKNRALLNKWLWCFCNDSNSLWKQVIVEKLGNKEDRLMSRPAQGVRVSGFWKSITKPLDGSCCFNNFVLDGHLESQVLVREFDDKLIWKGNTSGDYNTRSLYKAVHNNTEYASNWRQIWSVLAPFKTEIFYWKLVRGRLAVKDSLVSKGILSDALIICLLCKKERETIGHLFFTCECTWLLWKWWGSYGMLIGLHMGILSRVFYLGSGLAAAWKMENYGWLIKSLNLSKLEWPGGAMQNASSALVKTISKVAKFNTDGASRGIPDKSGIDGPSSLLLRKLLFSLLHRSGAPLPLFAVMKCLEKVQYWQIRYVPCSANGEADVLTKSGVQRAHGLLWINTEAIGNLRNNLPLGNIDAADC
ncbi:Uncharacterized protein TCM_025321 [Theobroma cacao]|uniref:Reverse transcriptase zinc-binding domain-containing protein n=1 Tax=Theobroma cacao TaxID=3641 RepID=A0A061EZT1_THECC|nr:Uncharacterized protein TCM_025321 [Theobroma cacao]